MAVNLKSEKNYQFEGQNTFFCLDQLLMTFIYQLDFFAPPCKEKGCHFVWPTMLLSTVWNRLSADGYKQQS